ncbi:MAG: T9SS type A sorting domain-containing protein [Flavisolibacter sp.]
MKRICTRIVTFCLLVTSQNLFAQNATLLAGDPSPISPAFGTSLLPSSANGFTSTNTGTFNDFAKGKTTSITSPLYFYSGNQSTIYFKINLKTATAGGGTNIAAPVISFISGSGTLDFTTSAVSVTTGTGQDYFFSVTPFALPGVIPANSNFQIKITFAVSNSDKTVTASSFATNALLAGAGAALPVKLVSYSGSLNKSNIQLQWLIAENETAEKFEIQKSTNGTSFTTEATISATHQSGNEQYGFSETASAPTVMYRLKMYDNNDKAEYSKILVFNTAAATQKTLQVLTNPVKDKLVLSFSNESNETAQLHIYDNSGRMIQQQNLSVSQGINTTTVGLGNNYKSGLYIVELVTKTARLSEKIIYSNQ